MRQMESKRPVLGGFCSVTGEDNTGVKGREVRINLRNTYKGKEFDDWVIVDSKNREIECLTPKTGCLDGCFCRFELGMQRL